VTPGSKLVLASGSPRRKDLLREAGFEFSIVVPTVDEKPREGETPRVYAERVARAKADAVAPRVPAGHCVLGADTVVVIDEEPLGKPRGEEEAVTMLMRLSGRAHRVLTGFALVRVGDAGFSGVEQSVVRMRPLEREEALAYVATREPLDKAGAYALQGGGGRFVESVEGSRTNVIGLPIERIVPLLARLGVQPS
jgi:septum formation protein